MPILDDKIKDKVSEIMHQLKIHVDLLLTSPVHDIVAGHHNCLCQNCKISSRLELEREKDKFSQENEKLKEENERLKLNYDNLIKNSPLRSKQDIQTINNLKEECKALQVGIEMERFKSSRLEQEVKALKIEAQCYFELRKKILEWSSEQ